MKSIFEEVFPAGVSVMARFVMRWHSMPNASRRAVLLGARIRLVCSLFAPCAAGALVISVRYRIDEQDH